MLNQVWWIRYVEKSSHKAQPWRCIRGFTLGRGHSSAIFQDVIRGSRSRSPSLPLYIPAFAYISCDSLEILPFLSYPSSLAGFHGPLAKTIRNLGHRTCQNIEKHITQLGNTAADILAVTDLFTELVIVSTLCIEPDTLSSLIDTESHNVAPLWLLLNILTSDT